MKRNLIKTLYRALLKECRSASAAYTNSCASRPDQLQQIVRIKPPVTGDLGIYNANALTGAAYLHHTTEQLVPGLEVPPEQATLSWNDIKKLIRANFDANKGVSEAQVLPLTDQAFAALRCLSEQAYLEACSSISEEAGVEVEATSCYCAKDPAGFAGSEAARAFFRYRIRITNNRPQRIRVLGRSWCITTDDGRLENVVQLSPDNGVVGQQPVIPPGGCFQYHSGTHLTITRQDELPSASMTGVLLVDLFGEGAGEGAVERVQVPVNPFKLMAPAKIGRK